MTRRTHVGDGEEEGPPSGKDPEVNAVDQRLIVELIALEVVLRVRAIGRVSLSTLWNSARPRHTHSIVVVR